jgi:hypothetical protein
MCKRCRFTHKLYINFLRRFIQFVISSAPLTHEWTPEKKRLIQKFIELWTDQKRKSSSSYKRTKKQTGDSALVQSKLTKTIYINSIRIINKYTILSETIVTKAIEMRQDTVWTIIRKAIEMRQDTVWTILRKAIEMRQDTVWKILRKAIEIFVNFDWTRALSPVCFLVRL